MELGTNLTPTSPILPEVKGFTDNQSVDPAFSTAQNKKLLKLIDDAIQASDANRNSLAIMSGSWEQDATKYESLYNGKLYDKREQLDFECKEDIYRDLVDSNAALMQRYDYKESIRQIGTVKNSLSAELMMRLIEYADFLNQAKAKEEEMLQMGGQMGPGVYKFQPFEADGYYWPGVEVVDPRQIGLSPGATSIKDAVYFYWKRPVPTSELKSRFPQLADEIKPDAELYGDAVKPTNSGGTVAITGLATGAMNLMNNMGQWLIGGSPKLQTWMTEFYYMDPEVIEIKTPEALMMWLAANPGFGQGPMVDKIRQEYERRLGDGPIKVKKYPFGRMLLTTKDVVMQDVANPYYRIPFFEWKCFARPKTFWPKGVCEVVRQPVKNYHLLMSDLACNLDYTLRPAYQEVGSRGTELGKAKQVNTMPNSLNPTSGEIKPIQTASIAPEGVINLAEIRRRGWGDVSGLNPTLFGVNPTGNYSAVQLEKLMEAALGKSLPRLRRLNRTRKELGDMKLWFVQNFCTEEREIEFANGEEIEQMTVNKYTSEDGSPVVADDVRSGQYRYYVDVDVKHPASFAERVRQIGEIAAIVGKAAPIEAARIQLEAMDIPGKQGYIDRFERAIKSSEEQKMRMEIAQMELQKQKQMIDANYKERDMDVKEIMAGAKVQEALAWVITNLPKAGLQIPPDVLNELNVVASKTTMETQGDAVGQ